MKFSNIALVTMAAWYFSFTLFHMCNRCNGVQDSISETKLMIALQRRNKAINNQSVFDDSPLILENASTSEIGKITQMYRELLESTNVTATDIHDRFRHVNCNIDTRVSFNTDKSSVLHSLHQFYQHANDSLMARGKAIIIDKSLVSYLSIKTRSIIPGEIEYVMIFFNNRGKIKYGVLSVFASDNFLSHAILISDLNRPSIIAKLINGQCIRIKFGSSNQFFLKLIKSDLYF